MYCPKCGFEITLQDAKFCPKCGFAFSQLVPSASSPPPTEGQSSVTPIPWWRIPLQISLFFFGGAILLGILGAVLISLIPNSEVMPIILVVLIIVLTLGLLIYKSKHWGWGWYLVFGITYTSIQKTYTGYGVYQGAIALFAIVTALFAYYAFRQKYLARVKKAWLRSFLAGVIALFVAGFFAGIISAIVPTQDHRVAKVIQNVSNSLQVSLKSFTEQNSQLWSPFVSEPATTEDFQTNLAIVQDAIPLFRRKDSILVDAMQRMYSGVNEIYDESLPKDWSLTFTPSDLQSILQKTNDIAHYDKQMLIHLSAYYKSVLSGDGNDERHWTAYDSSQQHLNMASQEYAQLFKQVLGYDMTQQSRKGTN